MKKGLMQRDAMQAPSVSLTRLRNDEEDRSGKGRRDIATQLTAVLPFCMVQCADWN